MQNTSKKIPHFLILDNPDFEYIACLHMENYHGQDVRRYLEQEAGDIAKFKAMKDVYSYLNSRDNSYKLMLSRLKKKIVVNKYQINKAGFEVKISAMEITWENEDEKGSNINEFFEVIDW